MRGALVHQSLAEAAQVAFLEGCIGETVAALEAAHARDTSSDPGVRSVLARIAEDEAQHAELAFRFVSWAMPQLDATFAEHLLEYTLEEVLREGRRSTAQSTTRFGDTASYRARSAAPFDARRSET